MMFPNNFPWRIFWRTFWTQLAGYSFILISGIFVAYWFLPISQDLVNQQQFQNNLFVWLQKVVPLLLIYSFLMAVYLSYRFVLPLASVIGRARAMLIKSKEKSDPITSGFDESIYEEEVGEYFELEQTLRRIRRKLKKKREQVFILREEHEALLTAMSDAVVAVDRLEKLTSFNSQFALQFLSQEQAQKELHLAEIIRQPEVLELFLQAVQSGNTGQVETQFSNSIGAGKKIYLVKVSALIKKKTGEIYGALGVFHDISELKRAEQIRIEFVENASHELRTPLTSVKGYVDTMKEDIEAGRTDNLKPFMDVIFRNVGRLVNLVNDLLVISKLESNEELIYEDLETEQLTSHINETLITQLQQRKQAVNFSFQAKQIFADSVKAEQVLLNLFSNASKYSPEGSQIDISWVTAGDGGVNLIVKDNGPGISPIHVGRLFERFYRVDKGRSREGGGTGLGLAIVKHIMQTHGGWVKVKSDLGVGTEFTCHFPKK